MSQNKIVWSDEEGDLRKVSKSKPEASSIEASKLILHLRRLTSGKGRTVIEISNLPLNKNWCDDLAKKIKKSLGVGGTSKNGRIEIHGEKMDLVVKHIESQGLKWKKIGG